MTFLLLTACTGNAVADNAPANSGYLFFYTGKDTANDKGIDWVKSIAVSTPAYGSDIQGDVTVKFTAPGMTKAKAMCWRSPTPAQPNRWGHDATVAPDIEIDASGAGSFVFHGDQFPNGPITLRIYAKDNGKKQDICELQLYNRGGVVWNQGIPKADPPGARGMTLAFADDFNGPLSISNDGNGAKYEAHKTGGGDFSGWQFANCDGPLNPFSQVGTYLRIHASKTANGQGSGLLSSAHEDGTGFYAAPPCYFECRFLAQSAPGTWPAFWMMSKNCLSKDPAVLAPGASELDVIEAYGGQGPHNPNFPGYSATTHFWNEKDANGKPLGSDDGKEVGYEAQAIPIMDLGGKSTWSTTFHTYGIKITPDEIVYYFDDIPVFRHTNKGVARTQPFWFLVNYAIGGISGWPIDLDRYNNSTDMWVDYIRVYQGNSAKP